FKYDYLSRRVEKIVVGGSDERFVYSGFKQIERLNALDSNSIAQKFIWCSGRILAMTNNSGTCYYSQDANKNVSEMVATDGTIKAHYEYSPFGKVTVSNGTLADDNPFRFSSEYADDETGLQYYNYRYCNPVTGKWLNRDPITEAGGWNLYGMVHNDTINTYDYLGAQEVTPHDVAETITHIVPGAEAVNAAGAVPEGTNVYLNASNREHAMDNLDNLEAASNAANNVNSTGAAAQVNTNINNQIGNQNARNQQVPLVDPEVQRRINEIAGRPGSNCNPLTKKERTVSLSDDNPCWWGCCNGQGQYIPKDGKYSKSQKQECRMGRFGLDNHPVYRWTPVGNIERGTCLPRCEWYAGLTRYDGPFYDENLSDPVIKKKSETRTIEVETYLKNLKIKLEQEKREAGLL
ncbi:MAG: hypothetical protein GT600_04475, partial [Bacteroidales bacterium]|nr:hypothetical protein [Bacteroidales bacterium]